MPAHSAARLEKFAKAVARLTRDERIRIARDKARRVSGHVTALIQTNANNRELIYSKRLADMLGPSYAAHALNSLQQANFAMELTRLCALWDAPAFDRVSLPTIAFFIADSDVVEQLRLDHAAGWNEDDPVIGNADELTEADLAYFKQLFREHTKRFAERTFRRNLARSLGGVVAVSKSDRLARLFGHRDRFIAHNLEQGSLARAGAAFQAPRYGYERKLLRTTQRIANALSVVTNNSSFAYDASRRFARSNSESFWNAIRLEGAR